MMTAEIVLTVRLLAAVVIGLCLAGVWRELRGERHPVPSELAAVAAGGCIVAVFLLTFDGES